MKTRRLFSAVFIAAMLLLATSPSLAGKPTERDANGVEIDWDMTSESGCTTIPEGELLYSSGHYLENEALMVGFDPFGYNYQAHMFKGSYANAYLGGDGYPPYEGDDDAYLVENPEALNHWAWDYRDVELLMKWNDAWLANSDCDGDGKLDRHYGYDNSYMGSGAWLTNHMWGAYDDEGETCQWDYFTKMIAVPEDAQLGDDAIIWYNADGTEIGPVIWGEFATIQTVENDPCAGIQGVQYLSPDHAGLGGW